MSELKVYVKPIKTNMFGKIIVGQSYYLKSEADKVIAEKDAEIRKLKNGITPNPSDKTLQERLKEVCKKHGVSTLQDLDWAFCMVEARLEDCMKSAVEKHEDDKVIAHHKYKRCLAMAKWCYTMDCMMLETAQKNGTFFKDSWCWKRALWYGKWKRKWLALAEKFKETK